MPCCSNPQQGIGFYWTKATLMRYIQAISYRQEPQMPHRSYDIALAQKHSNPPERRVFRFFRV